GDLPAAARHFNASLTIRERLAAADPANAAWQRDLSVSLNKLGDLAVAQGGLPAAARPCNASPKIVGRPAEADPANAAWQRDLWVSYWRLGTITEQQRGGNAGEWWRKAHDVLASMKRKGLFVSPQDEQVLVQLRNKLDR